MINKPEISRPIVFWAVGKEDGCFETTLVRISQKGKLPVWVFRVGGLNVIPAIASFHPCIIKTSNVHRLLSDSRLPISQNIRDEVCGLFRDVKVCDKFSSGTLSAFFYKRDYQRARDCSLMLKNPEINSECVWYSYTKATLESLAHVGFPIITLNNLQVAAR